jgi:hypothetical protein
LFNQAYGKTLVLKELPLPGLSLSVCPDATQTNKQTNKQTLTPFSVTRLGEISPFGRIFMPLGAFWADFFS